MVFKEKSERCFCRLVYRKSDKTGGKNKKIKHEINSRSKPTVRPSLMDLELNFDILGTQQIHSQVPIRAILNANDHFGIRNL